MKKSLKLLLLCTFICASLFNAKAQQYQTKHQFAVGYGAVPNSTWISTLEDITTIISTVGVITYDNDKDIGAISMEYLYHASDLIAVGAIGVYAHTTKDMIIGKNKEGTANLNFMTFMPAVKFDWLRKEHIGLYSKIGVGVSVINEKQSCRGAEDYKHTTACFNWQASFFGIEVGDTNIRGFAEFGVGEQGMLAVGVRFRF